MPQAAPRDPIYRRRHYSAELIEQCVRWYLTYRLSYRDLAAMMAEREVTVSHTTIMRWVRHYVPEYERRWSRFSKPTDSSWRMDETSVSVGGRWNYLYRAVDRKGKSVHSLLREDRTIGSAQEFFRQAVKVKGSPWPEKINLDGNAASHLGLRLLEEEDPRWRSVTVRARRYLNNVIEQDHRAIKQRSRPMLGLKSFHTAAVTFSGIELAHRIRKRQFAVAYERNGRALSLKDLWDQALSGRSFSDSLDISPPPLMHQISRRSPPRRRARRGRNGVVRFQREGCPSETACTFRSCPRVVGTGITAIALKVGRSSFPWDAIRTSRSRAPGRDATQRGTCLKQASIPAAGSRRCVESMSILSDQIARKPSYQNDSVRPGAVVPHIALVARKLPLARRGNISKASWRNKGK
jgi:transposase-like protein